MHEHDTTTARRGRFITIEGPEGGGKTLLAAALIVVYIVLGMLYDFLKTLAPIEHKVNPFPDAEPEPAARGATGS